MDRPVSRPAGHAVRCLASVAVQAVGAGFEASLYLLCRGLGPANLTLTPGTDQLPTVSSCSVPSPPCPMAGVEPPTLGKSMSAIRGLHMRRQR